VGHQQDQAMMRFLRKRIRHVIYVVKENRTYDQVFGDEAAQAQDLQLKKAA
jgi:phospholipase C